MKKLILSTLALSILLISCTTQKQDEEMLQKHFATVYHLENQGCRYVCIDTLGNVYDVVLSNGAIESQVKINR